MRFKQYGHSGDTIVFLLGANNEPDSYDEFFTHLGTKFRVIALNYPGIGNDDCLPKHTILDYVKYFHSLVEDELQISEYYLAGFSLGGYLALEYLSRFTHSNILGTILLSPMTKPASNKSYIILWKFAINWIQIRKHLAHNNTTLFSPLKNLDHFQQIFKHSAFALKLPPLSKSKVPADGYIVIIGENDLIIDNKYTKTLFDPTKTIILTHLGHNGFAISTEQTVAEIEKFTKDQKARNQQNNYS